MFSAPPEWIEMSWEDLNAAIRYFDAAAVYFTDLPFVKSDQASRLIDSLRDKGIVATTHIEEASAASNGDCPLASHIATSKLGVTLIDSASQFGSKCGLGHYLSLLAARRLYGQIVRDRVIRDYGRECAEIEVQQIAEHYLGRRGGHLAASAIRGTEDPTLFFGDELLVHGALYGIMEGADVVFLRLTHASWISS